MALGSVQGLLGAEALRVKIPAPQGQKKAIRELIAIPHVTQQIFQA